MPCLIYLTYLPYLPQLLSDGTLCQALKVILPLRIALKDPYYGTPLKALAMRRRTNIRCRSACVLSVERSSITI